MIFRVITCDQCNPVGKLFHAGVLHGATWPTAMVKFGWRRIKGKHVCQDCQEHGEAKP